MFKTKKLFSILLTLLMVFSLSACGTNTSKNSGTNDKSKSETKVNKKTTYPLTIKDSYDREITLDKEPKKIVSIAPNITETIFALEKQDKLVGRTDFCDYPKEAKNIQSIGGLSNPNIEKITELKPDVVIASTHFDKKVLKKLESLNIKVLVLYGEDNFVGAYETIKKVGLVVNAQNKADKIVSNMKKKISTIEQKVKGKDTPSVYYVISYGKVGDYTATGETFINQLIKMAGGKNIASDAKGWKYSIEKLVEKNPDIVICSKYFNAKKGVKQTNGYKDLSAVKNNKLFEVDNNLIDRQGPRLADGLEELAKTIHPELFK
ncbi:ABC transporter substrate-binding protein [Haloimpatiens sp. FM7330]|uniref:ABC transporter substrate-binding protein n=1 Tax=Haloimpatiens sp. FM7330 TaxID=3298610 RepID=UPI003643BA04